MPFTSLLFIFIFLPISTTLYSILPFKWWRTAILLLSSLIFYSWGEPLFVFLLILLAILNWFFGKIIERSLQKNNQRSANNLKILSIILNLLPLLVLKIIFSPYLTRLSESSFLGNFDGLTFPLGLSFFTFSTISYIIDVYRKDIKAENNFFDFALFLFMFPKIGQGPITRFSSVASAIKNPVIKIENIAKGCRRFVTGLAKKVLIADYIGTVSNKVFSLETNFLNPVIAWYGLAAFTLQIFLDFSAYTDMAIGLGNILGFELPENFNFPYISKSITEFWRRWHMTLADWFRSYLFIPLEISRRKERFFRQETNLIIVFLATGLWHGITLNFILWGLYFGIIIALESAFLGKWLKRINPFFQHLYAILMVSFGWVLFKLENIGSWMPFFRSLFGLNNSNIYSLRSLNILLYYPLMIAGVLLCFPFHQMLSEKLKSNALIRSLADIVLIGLLLLSVSLIASGNYQSFLYAEF
jgi:alginate O-acetyltransferase complex protein AlgI